jgi:hypothetical protein
LLGGLLDVLSPQDKERAGILLTSINSALIVGLLKMIFIYFSNALYLVRFGLRPTLQFSLTIFLWKKMEFKEHFLYSLALTPLMTVYANFCSFSGTFGKPAMTTDSRGKPGLLFRYTKLQRHICILTSLLSGTTVTIAKTTQLRHSTLLPLHAISMTTLPPRLPAKVWLLSVQGTKVHSIRNQQLQVQIFHLQGSVKSHFRAISSSQPRWTGF